MGLEPSQLPRISGMRWVLHRDPEAMARIGSPILHYSTSTTGSGWAHGRYLRGAPHSLLAIPSDPRIWILELVPAAEDLKWAVLTAAHSTSTVFMEAWPAYHGFAPTRRLACLNVADEPSANLTFRATPNLHMAMLTPRFEPNQVLPSVASLRTGTDDATSKPCCRSRPTYFISLPVPPE